MTAAIIYLVAISTAEVVTVLVRPTWGIYLHVAVLAALTTHAALDRVRPRQQLLLSLALAPLVRIVSLSMPLTDIPRIWWYPIIYAPLLIAAIVVVRLLNLKARDINFRPGVVTAQAVIALSGVAVGLVEYLILRPEPMVASFTLQQVWLPALIFVLTTGLVEEFIFRGVMQHTALAAFRWWGIVYISLVFAVLHVGFLSWIDVLFVFSVALFFAWMVKRTGSLFGVTLAHGIANTMLYLVAPFFL